MPSEKIVRAINVGQGDTVVFSTDDGREIPTPIVIHPDENGALWYWTPEPPEPME